MASIYLKSIPCENLLGCDLSQINNDYSINSQDILSKLSEITPNDIKPINHHIVQSSGGILVNYSSDTSINFIYTSENQLKLKSANINAELSNITKEHREIYISEVPNSIYNISNQDLITELKSKYNINILYLKKFYIPEKNSKDYLRYLVIALDSTENRNKFTESNKSIYLSSIKLLVANKRKSSGRKRSFQPQTPFTPQTQTYITRSAQYQGNALPNLSSWAGPRNNSVEGSQKNISTGYTKLYPKRQPSNHSPQVQNSGYRPILQATPSQNSGYNPIPHASPSQNSGYNPIPHASPPQNSGYRPIPQASPSQNNSASPQNSNLLKQCYPQQSDLEFRQQLEATNLACLTLSQGLEYPDSYVKCLNKTLKYMGHPMVTIPNSVLDISKGVYFRKNNKNSVNNNIPLFKTDINLCPPVPNSLSSPISSPFQSDTSITRHLPTTAPPQTVASTLLPSSAQPVNNPYLPDPAFLQTPQIPISSAPFCSTEPFIPSVPFFRYPLPNSALSQFNPNLNLHSHSLTKII